MVLMCLSKDWLLDAKLKNTDYILKMKKSEWSTFNNQHHQWEAGGYHGRCEMLRTNNHLHNFSVWNVWPKSSHKEILDNPILGTFY